MAKSVALCVDEQSYKNPELIGLEGETFDSQRWLTVFADAMQARKDIREDKAIQSVWVSSVGEVDPINLAASLKADRPELQVSLITGERCGSLCSRARAARIDEVLEPNSFIRRYGETKRSFFAPVSIDPIECRPLDVKASYPKTQDRASKENSSQKHMAKLGRKGTLVAVVSGSGGAGKSSVSTVMALLAARQKKRVLLLDYDLQFGDIAGMIAADNVLDIDTALEQSERFDRFLEKTPALSVLSCPKRLESAEKVVNQLPALLDKVSDKFDLIVANTGAAWAEQHAVLLERASIALFIIDQRSSSIKACRHALELCGRCGIATVPFKFALNRCAKTAPFASVEVSSVLQGAEVFELRDGGFEVEECLSGGAATELVNSNNEFVKSVGYMMGVLIPSEEGSGSFLDRPHESSGFFKRRNRSLLRRRGH